MARSKFVPTDVEEDEIVEKPKKKSFDDGDYIFCHSVIAGGLNVNCRSGNHYEFADYGTQCEIQYRDLVDLIHKRSDHIFNPRFIIDNEDFLAEFPELKKLYASLYSEGDFKEILKLPVNQMIANIKKLPKEVFPTMRSIAATMVGTGEIDSVRSIRALTDIFGADFNLLSELFSEK